MKRTGEQLRRDALAIWQAGVAAVAAERLVQEAVDVQADVLTVGDDLVHLAGVGRIAVVGAGKAGAAMAHGLEQALGPRLAAEKQLVGWVNVPEPCVRPLTHIHLHAARPGGVNEPTAEGVAGSQAIMRIVGSLQPDDLCFVLLSGGASALLPLPAAGITLADKRAVTQLLSASGATIEELNLVRKHLSAIKGGQLAAACRAGRMMVLVISDVLGDDLATIGSGPTVVDTSSSQQALEVLRRYDARARGIAPNVFDVLESAASLPPSNENCQVSHLIIGNNARAVDAAGLEAERLGYSHAMVSVRSSEGSAESVGRGLAAMALSMRDGRGPDCLISGGEPTVVLVPQAQRGQGGRNQQLVLAAADELLANDAKGVLVLSGGTDGEDGPTDAAGAFVDRQMLDLANQLGLEPGEFLARNDAYRWFEPLSGLIKTGPTHTNVCDLRVVLVDRNELANPR